MNIISVTQGTDDWKRARAGLVTASCLADVLAKPRSKNEESATRSNYRAQIIAERMTGRPCDDSFQSAAMQRGTELEPIARAAYEATAGALVDQVGLVLHPTIAGSGASPDGLVGDVGGCEIKVPNTATHIDYILRGVVPVKYVPQMQWNMACTGRSWWDFVSFDDRLPEDLWLFVKRLPRDDEYIAMAEEAVRLFNAEVDEYIGKLQSRKAVA
jgi:hypothetical protein